MLNKPVKIKKGLPFKISVTVLRQAETFDLCKKDLGNWKKVRAAITL